MITGFLPMRSKQGSERIRRQRVDRVDRAYASTIAPKPRPISLLRRIRNESLLLPSEKMKLARMKSHSVAGNFCKIAGGLAS